MRSSSTNWKLVFVFVAVLIILPILVYLWKFGSIGLSGDFKTWVDFSTYWSPYLVTALTVILAYISWLSLELMKLKEKALIVVEKRSKPNDLEGKEFISIRNIGSGPALDVKLFIKVISSGDIHFNNFLQISGILACIDEVERRSKFHYMVSSFSLSPAELIFIDWQEDVAEIGIVYTDIHRRTNTLLWQESGTEYFENDVFKVDVNGKKGKEMIYKKDKAVGAPYNQVFSLADVGKKRFNFSV